MWLWPAVSSLAALLAGLIAVDLTLPPALSWLAWPGGSDAAVALLQTVAGSVINVTVLTFTLTVVVLQLASQQFSPRLLRDFVRDPVIKSVLAVLLGTLVFTMTVLSRLDMQAPLPDVALLVVSTLSLIALTAALGFITHMTRVLRVDTMMRRVHNETDAVVDASYPAYDDARPRSPDELDLDPADAVLVPVHRSGFVRVVDVSTLIGAAIRHDAVISVQARPGDHVVAKTPLATVWPAERGGPLPSEQELREAVQGGVKIGYERTIEQDAAFGFRQLTDIAVKALSPGINDPVTAAHAVGHMADLLIRLIDRRLGSTLHCDDRGAGRVVVPGRDLPYFLDTVCGPIRRYGGREPTVLIALLRMLRDAATSVHDDHQREHLAQEVDHIIDEAADRQSRQDAAQVNAMAERVRHALRGDVQAAYRDRSGETRSL